MDIDDVVVQVMLGVSPQQTADMIEAAMDRYRTISFLGGYDPRHVAGELFSLMRRVGDLTDLSISDQMRSIGGETLEHDMLLADPFEPNEYCGPISPGEKALIEMYQAMLSASQLANQGGE
ncbi:hypothetical protein [Ancylobacter oerskovii]|uniref:Uncharacterized protein n=1 Tax=Ancylobacter oerskovii TaxID=459519 RepID=A0ABW4Z1B0_9HYPH|nr:hypothetical protein [Ancylobacter oerskovii]MBS7542539.1 hypothetical protein [Ancylobacter oerskovii]